MIAGSQAKLYETYDQSVARYGQPSEIKDGTVRWNINDDFCILATFGDPKGRCDKIWFLKWDGPYTEQNLESIIKFNTPSNYFYQEQKVNDGSGNRFWMIISKSKRAMGSVLYSRLIGDATTGRDPFSIALWTEGAHQRYEAAQNTENAAPAMATNL